MNLPPDVRAALRDRCSLASPPPWLDVDDIQYTREYDELHHDYVVIGGMYGCVLTTEDKNAALVSCQHTADAAFIATAGPWRATVCKRGDPCVLITDNRTVADVWSRGLSFRQCVGVALFIAHAREDMPPSFGGYKGASAESAIFPSKSGAVAFG